MEARSFFQRLVAGLGLCCGVWMCGGSPNPPDRPAADMAGRSPVPEKLTLLLAADRPTTATASLAVPRPAWPSDPRQDERATMVRGQIEGRGVEDRAVLAAMRRVPRHLFVEGAAALAYGDYPLPIGHGQTISQPYIVGYMSEILKLKPEDRVLEIGAGSGYQAAILGEIVREVDTIEIIDELARKAAARLRQMGYRNINVLGGDGYFGWRARAPYDAIIVTAAATHIPPPLLSQLKPGGRMTIPVGQEGWNQNLLLIEKQADGSLRTRNLLPVQFVPLTRRQP